jgi:4-amino-4-deoxy-L-arabinose transferase-like glycosyltransferase
MNERSTHSEHSHRRSIALIVLTWLVLQVGGLFSPGLLDDVDSIYIEIAREMLHRHDYVTPYIDGIRFFDKPPLMYWMAAGSMAVFGEHDWAARLPLAIAVLALLVSVYALGLRLYQTSGKQTSGERAALYSALALGTSIGPYLYTRFFIPDILICLWMTLGVHLFLMALDRASAKRSALWPCLGFAVALALNLLTKGLIGLVFPLGFVFFYLLLTRQFRLLPRFHLLASTGAFLLVALPWHVMAALRNPAIAMPAGLELPAKAGWAWFYLYNEHVARFLGKRVPHDYGLTPVWLFLVYALLWVMPWSTFLPGAIAQVSRQLGHRYTVTVREREAALTVTVWALLVLGFFTLSNRQEYYSLPALPALALMIGGFLARAECRTGVPVDKRANRTALLCHGWLLMPLASVTAVVCAYFAITAPHPAPGTDLASLLSQNPALYNLSLGHLFDLTGDAMGLFRRPLVMVTLGMLALGLISFLLRRSSRTYSANLTLAGGMLAVLLAMHEGLVRFNPILGSKSLADAIVKVQKAEPRAKDLIVLDGELTSGSTLLFYTRQPVHLVNGRINGPWFGSFWPDAPAIFETDESLRTLWQGPGRVFLLTYNPVSRAKDLGGLGPVRTLAAAGGKSVLTNR